MKSRILRIINASVFVVVLCHVAVAQNLSDEEFAEMMRVRAEQGDAEAQNYLGLVYSIGQGVYKDKSEAVRWWRKAAEQGNADAQLHLGRAYYFGQGVYKDRSEAVRWWRKAAEQGNADAQLRLGNAYYFGGGVEKDGCEAVRWYRKAADQGFAPGQYRLGMAYSWRAFCNAANTGKMLFWYGKAVEQEYADAQDALATHYWVQSTLNERPDLKDKAIDLWRKAAAQGHEGAIMFLRDFAGVDAVDPNESEADRKMRELTDSANEGDADAQYALGLFYSMGGQSAADTGKSARLFQRSESWLLSAARQGHVEAQYVLADAYRTGKTSQQDKGKAAYWYREAADTEHARAQLSLGSMLFSGEGIKEDKREAVSWWRKAADQGVAGAQYNLGLTYWNGLDIPFWNEKGVTMDKREAVRWWRKAAEQGDVGAQNNLGFAYLNGDGAIMDKREAYVWYSLAAVGGEGSADSVLREFNWRKHLSQSEIRSAQKEAAQRMDAIDRRKAQNEQESEIAANIATATKPKDTNIAAHVFENTWRSVVVVQNGDGQGSGVIVRPNIIATNCHVVDGRGSIVVYKADNRRADTETAFPATIRQSDEDKDFCLLDVAGLWGVPVTVRKYDTLSVGEDVYGLGAPQGLDLSLSGGVISQLRELRGNRFIQTDAAISPGSSGGGLFDSKGNLIGILTAKIVDKAAEGIGFAIPADLVLGY